MTLRTFETNDAKYYLGLGNHDTPSTNLFEDVKLSSLDFIVLEDCGLVREDGRLSPDYISNFIQYKELIDRTVKENPNIDIYGVDINLIYGLGEITGFTEAFLAPLAGYALINKSAKRLIKRRNFLKNLGLLTCGGVLASGPDMFSPIMMINSYRKEGTPIIDDIRQIRTNLLPGPSIGFRDAITAKKVSEYLVPRYKKPNKKVQAALVYGAAHCGIEFKLMQPWINDVTTSIYSNSLVINSIERLNEVRKYSFKNDKSRVSYESCNLF